MGGVLAAEGEVPRVPGSTWKRIGSAVLWMAAGAAAAPARGDVPPPDYDFQWANISDRNNAAYPGLQGSLATDRGSVSYAYRISRLETSTQQWADFLNMALRQGVNLDSPRLRPSFWGASLSGGSYVVNAPMRPVIGLNWRAGAYYCNWLNNGKQESWTSCLSGAYDTSTFGDLGDGTFTDQSAHSPGAKFWIPTLDEWLKAAHYDPNRNGAGQGGWWNYPYRSDSPPIPGAPGVGQTSAGWKPGGFGEFLVPLGAYTTSTSTYGLWDLSGGAAEWLEDPVNLRNGRFTYRLYDGSYAGGFIEFDHVGSLEGAVPGGGGSFFGFRIASQIPTPSGAAVMLAAIGACASRRRRGP